MTKNVLIFVTGIPTITVTDHRMHPKLRILALIDEVCAHGRGNDIGDQWFSLGQVGGKVHLLPSILLFDLFHAGEAEVLADALPFHKIDHAV